MADKSNLVTVTTPYGYKITVTKESAPAFLGFLGDLKAAGYKATDSGSYNNRTIRGSTRRSQHALGTAIDVSGPNNGMQYANSPFFKKNGLKTDLPKNVSDMAAKWGLTWGGNWKTRKDPMHFEYRDGGKPRYYTPGQTWDQMNVPTVMSKPEYTAALETLGFKGASAVKQFQRAAGIKTDGIVGKDTTRELRAALAQATTFADRNLVPPADIPTTPALTTDGARAIYQDQNSAAQPVSASDLVRQYGGLQGNPVPTIPVERAPVADLTPRAADIVAAAGGTQYDPLSSVATPAASDVVRTVAPEATRYDPLSSVATPSSIIAAAGQRGIGSDPDRNYGDPSSPDFGRDIEATNYARQSLADYASLRNGYPAENGTNAALPPARGLETMGANSVFDDPGVESYTPQPLVSSRMTGYDPLSSIATPASIIAASAQAPPDATRSNPMTEAEFNDRWGAAGSQFAPISNSQFDDRWNAALGSSTPAQVISNAAFNDRWSAGSVPVSSASSSPSTMESSPALGVIRAAAATGAPSPASFDARYSSATASPSGFDNSYAALGPVVAPSRQPAPTVDQTRTASVPARSYDPLSSVQAPTETTTSEIDTYSPASEASASSIIKAAASGQKQTSFAGKEKDDFVGTPQADVVMTQKADGSRIYGDTTPAPLTTEDVPTPRERPLQKEYSQPGPLKKGGGFANTGVKNKTALGVIGAALGAMAGSPALGAAVGKTLGKVADRYSPVYNMPALQGLKYIGSGLGPIQSIINGSAPANSIAVAKSAPAGYGVTWSNSGPGGSAQQHVSTPSGGGYTVTSIGPSLSPIVATTYDSSNEKRRDSTSGGSGNSYPTSAPSAGGIY